MKNTLDGLKVSKRWVAWADSFEIPTDNGGKSWHCVATFAILSKCIQQLNDNQQEITPFIQSLCQTQMIMV